jgi:hypothetical protein
MYSLIKSIRGLVLDQNELFIPNPPHRVVSSLPSGGVACLGTIVTEASCAVVAAEGNPITALATWCVFGGQLVAVVSHVDGDMHISQRAAGPDRGHGAHGLDVRSVPDGQPDRLGELSVTEDA